MTKGSIKFLNLDDYSKSIQDFQQNFMNFKDISLSTTPTNPLTTCTTTLRRKLLTTFIILRNINNVKCKKTRVFSPIIKILDRHNKVLVDAMECIN
jgi:hypothetical protein